MALTVGTGSPGRPAARRRRAAGGGRGLSREAIVDRALDIVDAAGMGALSMRSLAQTLDVGPASLYAHVSGKAELVDLLLDRVYADLKHPVPDPGQWRAQLLEFMARAREALGMHRDLARAESTAELLASPHALDCAETLLALLRAAGLPDADAVHGADLLIRHLTWAAVRLGRSTGGPEAGSGGLEDADRELLRGRLAALPRKRFPVVASMASALAEGTGVGEEGQFDLGLEVIIGGLLARRA
jgi:AcrR family transcriptional regulator